MRRSAFHFDLPEHLIAQEPASPRRASRLLVLDGSTGAVADAGMRDLPDLLSAGDLLVLNDTRVIPARLYARKPTGGAVEILIERALGEHEALAALGANRKPPAGAALALEGGGEAVVVGREGEFFRLRFALDESLEAYLERCGHMPLPPYIERADKPADRERYQTVFASRPGAVAAPTAGLHFDETLLAALDERGIERAFVTLHVGAGTFQPVRAETVEEHRLHAERVEVSAALCERVARTRERGGRVVAVGTTTVRSLETAAGGDGVLRPFSGESDLFIYPGYRFRMVDALVTNFHLPESSLLMLVAAFGGYEHVMAAYRHAVAAGYRFYSYGDAMLVTRPAPVEAARP